MSFDHQAAFTEIARQDSSALDFLTCFFNWAHSFDDLVDRDQPIMLKWPVMAHLKLLECVSTNIFFQKHRATLLPVIQVGALSYLDSERFKKSENVLDRIGSQVLKSDYQSLFFVVARLTGGDDHMLAMSEKYRAFSFDAVPTPDEAKK